MSKPNIKNQKLILPIMGGFGAWTKILYMCEILQKQNPSLEFFRLLLRTIPAVLLRCQSFIANFQITSKRLQF